MFTSYNTIMGIRFIDLFFVVINTIMGIRFYLQFGQIRMDDINSDFFICQFTI
jgi:hypothetical protein